MRQQGEAGAEDANTPHAAAAADDDDAPPEQLVHVEVSGSKRKRMRGLFDYKQNKIYVKNVGQVC